MPRVEYLCVLNQRSTDKAALYEKKIKEIKFLARDTLECPRALGWMEFGVGLAAVLRRLFPHDITLYPAWASGAISRVRGEILFGAGVMGLAGFLDLPGWNSSPLIGQEFGSLSVKSRQSWGVDSRRRKPVFRDRPPNCPRALKGFPSVCRKGSRWDGRKCRRPGRSFAFL